MSDQKKSTSTPTTTNYPDHWERWPAIREPVLLHLPPDAADSIRELGRVLYELVDHFGLYQPPGSWTAARLGAAVAELRFVRQYLEELAEARFASSLSKADTRLAERAQAWAVEAEELAAEIEIGLREEGAGDEEGAGPE